MSPNASARTTSAAVALLLTAAAAIIGGSWGAVVPLEEGSCAVGHRMCLDGSGCVAVAQWCDGKPDCDDETDEFSCGEASSNEKELEEAVEAVAEAGAGAEAVAAEAVAAGDACAPGEHRCLDGTCISKERICDGPRDCFDGSDEDVLAGCHGNSSACDKDEFRCSDGSCIPFAKTCDEHADCPDGGDELIACPTTDVPCHDGFRCANDHKCIPLEWVCDGQEECRDGSDEGELLCLNWVMPTRPATTPPAPRKKSSGSRREVLTDTPLATEADDPCSRMAPEHQRICRDDQVHLMKVEELKLRQRAAQEDLEVAQQELAAAKQLAEEQLTAAQLRRQAASELLKQQEELYNIKLQTLKQSLDKQGAIPQNVSEISVETNATANDLEDTAI